MTELKTCTKCGEDKPATVEYFYRTGGQTKYRIGLRGGCKDCERCYSKQYREENPEKANAAKKKWAKENPEYGKKWREENREEAKAAAKKYREENPEKANAAQKKYREENPEKVRARKKKWCEENAEYRRGYQKKWCRERMRKDPVFRLMKNMRSGLYKGLKGLCKSESTFKYIGMTPDQLMGYLKGQFTQGMTQDNYGKWHVDHIRPLASFDLTGEDKEAQLHQAWNYTNLQPLWAKDNITKGARYEEG